MKQLKEVIKSNISGKKVLILFVITTIVYLIMLLLTIPRVMEFSNGLKLLDMMPFGYDATYIRTLFDTLGEEGRQRYLYNQIPVDMIYPGLFGITYCLLIAYFLNKINKLKGFFFYLCFIPLIAGFADYLENYGIIYLLNDYPNLSENVMWATNLFSIVKSATTSIFFILIIVLLFLLAIQRFRGIDSQIKNV